MADGTTLSLVAKVVCDDQELSEGTVDEITVGTGCDVEYTITGVLGGDASQGLALYGFDLELVGGGAMSRAEAPTELPLSNFAYPDGINNPVDGSPDVAGFGGTPSSGKLLQCGGGQNSIKNTTAYAPFPIAETIVTGIGNTEVVLMTGTVTVPGTPGDYTLTISEPFANVVDIAALPGDLYWKTVAADMEAPGNLVIHVVDGSPCPCSPCLTIDSTNPPSGAIDAGIPHDINNTTPYGWESIEITFTDDPSAAAGGDFVATERWADGTEHPGPAIGEPTSVGPNTLTLPFDRPITANAWTMITYCGQTVCIGYVPGDAGQDGEATVADVSALIDCLNEVSGPCDLWTCDIDRLGTCTGADIGSVVDLLNAAGTFDPPTVDIGDCPW